MSEKSVRSDSGMSELLSLYLDLLRFSAAFLVLLSHAQTEIFGPWLWQIREYGSQGVVVFFVMSGYVIAYTAHTKNKTLRDYTIARAARLYSVVVPAVVVSLAVDLAIRHFDPAYYSFRVAHGAEEVNSLVASVANLTFTSQLWFFDGLFWCNRPFWSVGYEAPFYAIFAATVYFSGRRRTLLVVAIAALMGPRILLLLPLWLLGVASYQLVRLWRPPAIISWALFFLSGLATVFFLIDHTDYRLTKLVEGFLGEGFTNSMLPHGFQLFFPMAVAMAVNFFALGTTGADFPKVFSWIGRLIRYAAGATFTLYLFHWPLMTVINAALQGSTPTIWRSGLLLVGLIAALFAIAHFTERRKEPWTVLFSRLLPTHPRTTSTFGSPASEPSRTS